MLPLSRQRPAEGARNPNYDRTFVFTNHFSALLPDTPEATVTWHALLHPRAQQGTCRVLCFSPRHDLTLPEMDMPDIRRVVDLWAEETTALG